MEGRPEDDPLLFKSNTRGSGVFDPCGSRQRDAAAYPFGSLLAGINNE